VFLNSPENIQHVCATNVKNYNMRYLPVRRAAAAAAAAPGAESEMPARAAQIEKGSQQCPILQQLQRRGRER
jgi:hypothetical protein